MRIGVLGGTFDPPHMGHIALAHSAIETLELDEVMMLPAFRNPLKKGHTTPAKQRMEMVTLAIQDDPKLSLSDIEVSRGGASYAVDTLSELTYIKPSAQFWFILGFRCSKGYRQVEAAAAPTQNVPPGHRNPRGAKPRAASYVRPRLRPRFGGLAPHASHGNLLIRDQKTHWRQEAYGTMLHPDVLKYIEANKLYAPEVSNWLHTVTPICEGAKSAG